MEKIKKTFREIFEYNNTVTSFINRNPKNANTHLAVVINRLAPVINKEMKPYNKIVKKYNKKMDDLKADFAHVDSEDVLQFEMIDSGNGQKTKEYKYKRGKYKELGDKLIELTDKMDEELEAFMEQVIEFYPKFSVRIPADLTEWEKEVFSGIIIDPSMLLRMEAESHSSNGKSENPKSELEKPSAGH